MSFLRGQTKEGNIKSVKHKTTNPNGKIVTIMDNNFFANPRWEHAMLFLQANDQPVDFQGIDVRLISNEQSESLGALKHHKQIKIAWDQPKDEKAVLDGIARLTRYIKPYKIMCYVLIGFQSTEIEDLHRVETLRKLKIDPFVMPYSKTDPYQKRFARWVNHKAIFKSVNWEEYR